MASSETDICNLAIARARSTRFIETLDEASNEGAACKLWYPVARDYVLSRADWPFARKRVQLTPTGTPPAEWGYRYALPSDCIVARGIEDGKVVRTLDERIAYQIENDGTGNNRVILLNETAAVLIYTMRVTTTAIFSEGFRQALIWYIAAQIALPLDKKEDFCIRLAQIAETMIAKGAAQDYNEEKHPPAPSSEHFNARLGY
jgi:hypothetical protein